MCQQRRKRGPVVFTTHSANGGNFLDRLRKCENERRAGAATTQDAYGREIFRLHAVTRKVRTGREVSPPNLHTAKNVLTFDPAA